MNDDEIAHALRRAEGMAKHVSEPFRAAAFSILAKRFLEPAKPALSSLAASPSGAAPALAETLKRIGATTHVDRVLGMVYYRFKKDGESSSLSELRGDYKVIREKLPANLSDIVGKLVRDGFLVQHEKAGSGKSIKAWTVTSLGEQRAEVTR